MQEEVQRQFEQGNIRLVHKDSGKPMFVAETNMMQARGRKAMLEADESLAEFETETQAEDAELVSRRLFKTHFILAYCGTCGDPTT